MRLIEELKSYPPIHKIFELFKDEKNAVFLDSSLQNRLGNYSIIGLHPYLELVNGKTFTVNGEVCPDSFETFVKEYLKTHKDANDTGLPIVSGAIGYFSYDYGRKKAGVATSHKQDIDVPDSILCFYDVFIIEDHNRSSLYLIANGHNEDSRNQIDMLKESIALVDDDYGESESFEIMVESNFTKSDYLQAVATMIDYIVEGDIYIVNLTQQLKNKQSHKTL